MMWKAVVLLLLALFGDFARSSYAPHPKTKTADHHHHQQTDHDGAKKTRHLAKDHDLGKVFSDIIGGLSGLSARFELSGSLDHDRSQSLDAHLVVKKKMEAAKDKTVLADSGLEAVALQVPVVEESDILLEEVMGSVEGKVGGGLFDSHLEGKVGGGLHLEGEVVGGQLDISLEGTVGGEEEGKRVKRQVHGTHAFLPDLFVSYLIEGPCSISISFCSRLDSLQVEQADIREALCRDKNPGQAGLLGTEMKDEYCP